MVDRLIRLAMALVIAGAGYWAGTSLMGWSELWCGMVAGTFAITAILGTIFDDTPV